MPPLIQLPQNLIPYVLCHSLLKGLVALLKYNFFPLLIILAFSAWIMLYINPSYLSSSQEWRFCLARQNLLHNLQVRGGVGVTGRSGTLL